MFIVNRSRLRTLGAVIFLLGFRPLAACPPVAQADEPEATGLYQQIVDAYLDGKWDEVERGLLAPPEKLTALNAREREDIAYIRLAREELVATVLRSRRLCRSSEVVGRDAGAAVECSQRRAD